MRSIESKNENDPTSEDYLEIKRKADNLGRGDLVHNINNHLHVLEGTMAVAKRKGWDIHLRKVWSERFKELNKVITQVNMDKAREKGLL